jgi:CBS domain-containing protein
MNIDKVMTRTVKCCHAEDSLSCAAGSMWDADCGCVPVVDHGERVVGVLTDRDICMAGYFRNAPLSELRIADAMAKQPITCKASDSIETAEALMQDHQIRRVPVVDDEGKLVGILSLNDLARFVRTPAGKKALSSEVVAARGRRLPASGEWLGGRCVRRS